MEREASILGYAFAGLLLLIPTRLAFGPLGGSATPAIMLGWLLLVLWVGQRLGESRPPRWQPLHVLVIALVVVMLLAYAHGQAGGLLPDEVRAADRAVLVILSLAGVVLYFTDCLADAAAVRRLLAATVWLSALLAGAGLMQFITGFAVAEWIRVPGLRASYDDIGAVQDRLGLDRISAMATHPIEFGVVLAAVLAIALQFAFRRRLMWLPTLLIAAAIPISGSRSAVICAGVVVLLMLPMWLWWQRIVAVVSLACAALVIDALSPGLLARIGELFTGVSSDISTRTRISDYDGVLPYLAETPWLGRGPGTFLPGRYLILDNQFLLTLVDAGLLGLLALLALLVGALCIAYLLRGRLLAAGEVASADLVGSLAAALGALAVSFAFFDIFSFTMATGLLALLLGCLGALWRVSAPQSATWGSRPLVRT